MKKHKDIVVKVNVPVNVDFKHLIEDKLKDALSPLGFTAVSSTYDENNHVQINYFQFGVAIDREVGGSIREQESE